jgi:cytochrome c2
MNKLAIALGAGLITAIAVTAVVAVQAKRGVDSAVQKRSYGPDNEVFTFTKVPDGKGGPAADCVVCHSLSRNDPMRAAPTLAGIVGAPKARSHWFAYSLALRKKGGVWSEDELDKFLANPSGFIPGTSKVLPPIKDAARRKALIAYLKTLQG